MAEDIKKYLYGTEGTRNRRALSGQIKAGSKEIDKQLDKMKEINRRLSNRGVSV